MILRKPKTSDSPNYLPPAPQDTPECGAHPDFNPQLGCTRELGHETQSPQGSRDHAAHHDLAGMFQEPGTYDVAKPMMVARWGKD